MGFNPFKKARKFVSKIIPNEVKPFLPYLMAAMPGGMGLSAGLQKFGGDAFLKAALTRGITDDEADLKDSLRTGIIAAAPNSNKWWFRKFRSTILALLICNFRKCR